MATLNIKDFPDGLYKRLKARARKQGIRSRRRS